MNTFKTSIEDMINQDLVSITISNPRKSNIQFKKIKVRPINLSQELQYQVESFTKTQAFHKNITRDMLLNKLNELYEVNDYKQMDIYTVIKDYHMLINKKGAINLKSKPATKKQNIITHNRPKSYILKEGKKISFLIKLGIMTNDGKIIAKKYDKFKQINRYLEMIEDVIPHISNKKKISIIDFGCGKAYLTFALYYYLVEMKGYSVNIVGLDLKEDVIQYCDQLSRELGYADLAFKIGDIAEYNDSDERIDMVITLHACDTATDEAIKKAVNWQAKVIMSVPCCQHELNAQIHCEPLEQLLKYGLIKERMSALITDGMRANWLEAKGYKVQLLEFIDMEHTPKNILIRAVKDNQPDKTYLNDSYNNYKQLENYFNSRLSIDMTKRQ